MVAGVETGKVPERESYRRRDAPGHGIQPASERRCRPVWEVPPTALAGVSTHGMWFFLDVPA